MDEKIEGLLPVVHKKIILKGDLFQNHTTAMGVTMQRKVNHFFRVYISLKTS